MSLWIQEMFGCFALMWGMNCFRMCAAVWCVSTGTAAQPCISPRTIIQFQFLNIRMTGLKSNGTHYNRPIIRKGEWKHFITPLKVVSIQTISNKTTCALLWCIFFIYFLCLNSLLCVFVFSWECRPPERSSKNIISSSTLQNRDRDTNSYLLLLHLSLFLFRRVGWFPSQHVDPVVGGQCSPESEDHNYSCGGMTIGCATLVSVSLAATVPTHRVTKLTRGGRGRRKALLWSLEWRTKRLRKSHD